ncbi:dimethylaniline monooxygenase [N-oxide-forming] 2-like [Hyperolius riggenbachi]|uniref:dimethylaniline monooxygenase [N-oxide-forming] 2-like n=1 Tax=Hyperolius riggenbachi TaxID=752182 RepID=UPI0035A32C60
MVKTVAIIGAGVSGLVAIKSCLEENLEPTCFEKSDDIGGLWKFSDDVKDHKASIYNSLVTNSSKELSAFSDFPMPADFPNFLPHHKYYEYLKLYAENFKLVKYIQFKTKVCRLEKHPDFAATGRWKVTTEHKGQIKTAIFDAVFVCSGQNVNAIMPIDTFPGINNFKGKVLHSKEYKRPAGYDDKKVLIIGMGNSGVDISVDLCPQASQVYLSTRQGVWVIPRLGTGGYPYDFNVVFRFKDWIENLVPPAVSRWMFKRYVNGRFSHQMYNFEPEGILWKEPLVNDELPSHILSGSIIIKPGVTKFTETAAHFWDGTVVDNLDAVIVCTGFDCDFPFLDESVFKMDESKGSLYKKIIPLGIEKPTIAFLSFVRPVGSHMVLSELQSRWATRLFKGLHKLPDPGNIKREMLKDQERRKKWFATSEDNFRRTNYISYLDDLASDIGVKPNIWKLFFTDPILAFNIVFGIFSSYQYRLNGPGKWPGARKAILTHWERIHKPLNTRVSKQDPKLPLTSFMLLFLFFVSLFVALWLKN